MRARGCPQLRSLRTPSSPATSVSVIVAVDVNVNAPVIVAVHVNVNAPVDVIDAVNDQGAITRVRIATIRSNGSIPRRSLGIDELIDAHGLDRPTQGAPSSR